MSKMSIPLRNEQKRTERMIEYLIVGAIALFIIIAIVTVSELSGLAILSKIPTIY